MKIEKTMCEIPMIVMCMTTDKYIGWLKPNQERISKSKAKIPTRKTKRCYAIENKNRIHLIISLNIHMKALSKLPIALWDLCQQVSFMFLKPAFLFSISRFIT